MIKRLDQHQKLKNMLKSILFQGTRYTFEPDSKIINLGVMLGFLKEHHNEVVVANRIFETKLYNFFLSEGESDGKSMYYHGKVFLKITDAGKGAETELWMFRNFS